MASCKTLCSVFFQCFISLLLLVLPSLLHAQSLLPLERGVAVVSCASGYTNDGQANLDGYVLGLKDLRNPPWALLGKDWQPPMYHHPDWTARNLGQVFGLALDDDGNIYTTSTSDYYVSSWGSGGPGGVYKVDGKTGDVAVFASLPNTSPGLGNICFDSRHQQFFVTNFEDGKIYRLNMNGNTTGTHDPYRPDDGTVGFPVRGERLWGVAVHANRVWYSVWWSDYLGSQSRTDSLNEIRSVALDATGNFVLGSDRHELWIEPLITNGTNASIKAPVSDIAFASDGTMLLAERATSDTLYTFSIDARVLQYRKVGNAFGPQQEFSLGHYHWEWNVSPNSAGGIDYAFGFENSSDAYGSIWATSNNIWVDPIAGGADPQGIVRVPSSGNTLETVEATSHFVRIFDITKQSMGDIEIFRNPCAFTVDAGPDTTICLNDSVQLRGTTDMANPVWSWTPSTGLSCDDCPNPKAFPKTTTVYQLTVSDGASCTIQNEVEVRVEHIQPTFIPEGPLVLCGEDSVSLSVQKFASYRWSNGDTTQTTIARESGMFIVQVMNENGCVGIDSIKVDLRPLPTTSIEADGPFSICDGGSRVLTARPNGGTYRWSTGHIGQTLEVSEPGEYWVLYFDSVGCSAADTVQVTRADIIEGEILADKDPTLCFGDSVVLTARPNNAEYRWSTGESTQAITVSKSGEYTVEIIGADCPVIPDTIVITVLPKLDVSVVVDGSLTFCEGDSVRLEANVQDAVYRWSNGETGRSIVVADPGNYSVDVTDANGCRGVSDTVAVRLLPPPVAEAGDNVTICADDSIQLHGSGGVRYEWSPPEGLSCTDCPSPVVRVDDTKTYTLTVYDDNGCTATDQVTVTVDNTLRVIRASIPRNRSVLPGQTVVLPVILDNSDGADLPNEFEVEVRYEGSIMVLRELLQAGTASDGMVDSIIERRPGYIRFKLKGTTKAGNIVIQLRFSTWLGDRIQSEIPFSITLPERSCRIVESTPGLLNLDSVCGLEFRLIEWSGSSKNSLSNTPDPVQDFTRIHFNLALDGPALLEFFSSDGRLLGRLVDQHLEAGEYQAELDLRAYPPGLYFYRLTSGDWTETRKIMLWR